MRLCAGRCQAGPADLIPVSAIVCPVRLERAGARHRLPATERVRVELLLAKLGQGWRLLAAPGSQPVLERANKRKTKRSKLKADKTILKRIRKSDALEPGSEPSVKRRKVAGAGVGKVTAKVRVDRSDPNWQLRPRPDLTVWRQDPLFQAQPNVKQLC